MKKAILAIVAIFISWQILDFLIHAVLLGSQYEMTQHLWRPMDEMNNLLMALVSLVSAIAFVLIYTQFFAVKNLSTGFQYGLIFGIGVGFSMGFGTYSVQPISGTIAWGWFLGTVVEAIVAGLILGAIVKDQPASEAAVA